MVVNSLGTRSAHGFTYEIVALFRLPRLNSLVGSWNFNLVSGSSFTRHFPRRPTLTLTSDLTFLSLIFVNIHHGSALGRKFRENQKRISSLYNIIMWATGKATNTVSNPFRALLRSSIIVSKNTKLNKSENHKNRRVEIKIQ